MAKLLSLLVLVAMFVLLIPTGLVLASQDAVPGDATYPIKRKLEEIIISAASIHPATRAYFSVDFSNRRFTETTKLFARGSNDEAFKTLEELIEQSRDASVEVRSLQDKKRRLQLVNQLVKNLEDYDKQLEQIQTGAPASTTPAGPTPTPVLVQVPQRQGTDVIIIVVTATPTPRPTITPTPTPKPVVAGQPQAPTPTPRPATATQPAPPTVSSGFNQDQQNKIDEAQNKIDEIKKEAEAAAEKLIQEGFSSGESFNQNNASRIKTQTTNPDSNPSPGGRGALEADGPVRVASSCTPGVWDATHCGVCNPDGVSWNECTDFGDGNNTQTWCACAAKCRPASCQLNTSCTAIGACQAEATPTPVPTRLGCNDACNSDSQCNNDDPNRACLNGFCRLSTNPSSITCSPP